MNHQTKPQTQPVLFQVELKPEKKKRDVKGRLGNEGLFRFFGWVTTNRDRIEQLTLDECVAACRAEADLPNLSRYSFVDNIEKMKLTPLHPWKKKRREIGDKSAIKRKALTRWVATQLSYVAEEVAKIKEQLGMAELDPRIRPDLLRVLGNTLNAEGLEAELKGG